ncbi:hypothetical protein [Anaerobacillus sp. 1_MG-2023]|uniref:hypothetical protein n=1 Tax=Bacillales TaxID=1385 RepID=UPI0026E1FA2A|nr:hypothetical protein [Anaerobacillus sp. 1_MG-2023]MDO6657775.1 hypothetical protein [Anaerobacillus sp. 1_MG-2023]
MNTKRDSGIKVAAFLVGWMILIFGVITGIIVWNVSQSWFDGVNVIGSSLFFGVILLGLSQIMTYQEQQLSETEELKRMIKDRRE